ncbi:MAG TPA: enoyl-CoA hydratase/isomerase family protein [Candidatus Pseudogracilibacillus intestinigallinarum]|uniref:Enoyl-CoA hydratase/isomerase family protein n=1 Tax=Candidatus Pseudogracilibacillus intestinigallinarum TaxID=2838742 RepID=A0A9D1PPE2_9BACI|nr:enoyl-CoA hydratase/isomerase family protein [Candidatus Pseudogracilibacillus intestinigallinarum]
MSQLIVTEKTADNILVVTINRPEAANALSKATLHTLNETIDMIYADDSIRAVIITGTGEKAFSAGADLKERRDMNEKEVVDAVTYIGDTINRIGQINVPVIAALNGVAFGGGLELALACDIRIASQHVKVGLTETSLAIIPGAGGTQRLTRLIGLGQAKRLIYTATPVTAQEALQLGLVEQVTESCAKEAAIKMAQKIAANGPIAVKQAKLAITNGMETDLQTALQIERLSYLQTIPTKDRLEGLQAFKEKRKPNYEGK